MKTILLSLSFIILTLSFMSCEKDSIKITPSNEVSVQNYTISEFDELDISDPFQVYVRFSDTDRELRIEANENLHSLIQVKEKNGTLSIKLDDDIKQINGTAVLKVFLSTNQIKSIIAQGATKVYIQDDWNEDQVAIELTGASSLEGTLITNRLRADLTGASNLKIAGSTTSFDIEASGASDVIDFDFETDKLVVDLSGGCNIALTVNEELEVTADGGSSVHYQGDGVVTKQDLSGGSTIVRE